MKAKKKAGKPKKGVLNKVFLLFNILAVCAILLSYMSLCISPEKNWLLPFFGLLYPYFLILNLLFVLWWLIRLKWYVLISLISVLIGWNIVWRTVQIGLSTDPLPPGKSFQVMSYNVRNLSNNNLLIPDPQIREAILRLIRNNKPDILCMQEFEAAGDDPLKFIDSLSAILELPYFEYAEYNERNTRRIDAIITFSRFPIIYGEKVKKDDLHHYCLINDMVIGADTVRLFNIHLESVRFRHEDYTFINDLDLRFEEDENIKEGSRRIFTKLKRAYQVRAAQVRALKDRLDNSPYPVIICGDFNDIPCSYSYQSLSAGKRDAFIESGTGVGNTYAGTLPSLRIDYILYDPVFRAYNYTTGREKISDHYPVAARIGVRSLP